MKFLESVSMAEVGMGLAIAFFVFAVVFNLIRKKDKPFPKSHHEMEGAKKDKPT